MPESSRFRADQAELQAHTLDVTRAMMSEPTALYSTEVCRRMKRRGDCPITRRKAVEKPL